MRLEAGQTAVVTGAGSGIGLAMCHQFARRGLDIVLVDVDEPTLETAVADLARHGGRCRAMCVDVSDAAAMDALAARVLAEFGRVDLVCSNAGVLARRTVVWDVPERDVNWLFGVNVFGVYNALRSFVPVLIEQGRGHIVHTASNVGLEGIPGLGLYGATKHAVVGLTWLLMRELAELAPEVGVTLLCPGGTHTNLHLAEKHRPEGLRESDAHQARERWPLPPRMEPARIPAEDVARQVVVAVERNQALVVTDSDAVASIRSWLAAIEADLRRSPAESAPLAVEG